MDEELLELEEGIEIEEEIGSSEVSETTCTVTTNDSQPSDSTR